MDHQTFRRCLVHHAPGLPGEPSRLGCLMVFGPLPAVTAVTTAEIQLNLKKIYAPRSFIAKQKFGLFFISSKWFQPPLHCNCVSEGQTRSENNEIIIQ